MNGEFLIGVDGFGSTGKDVVCALTAYIFSGKNKPKNKQFVHADVGRVCRASGLWFDDNNIRPEEMGENIHLIKEIDYNFGEPKINGIVFPKERLDSADKIVALYMNAEGSLNLKKEKIWPSVANHMVHYNLLATGRETRREGAILDLATLINPQLESLKVFFHGDLRTLAKWRALSQGLTSPEAVLRVQKGLEERIKRDVAGGQHPDPNSFEFAQTYDITFDVTKGDIGTNVGRFGYEIKKVFPSIELNKRRAREVSVAHNKKPEFIEEIIKYGLAA